ncbi:MAG: ribosomal protein S18 acetylase RimI-like enzyme [Woeseiaceae bacterium]|jgi:ribosomal protein S18 acetylase RimI-like enzyme
MHKAVAKEGPRAPLFYLGVAILLPVFGIAAAQTVEQSDLEFCASQETAALKLACFEALTEVESKEAEPTAESLAEPPAEKVLVTTGVTTGAAGSGAETAVSAVKDNQVDAVDESIPGERVTADIAVDDTVDDRAVSEEALADATVSDNAVADESRADATIVDKAVADETRADATITDSAVSEDSRADELGREYLDEEKVEEEDAEVRLTVREVVKGNYDVLYFHFANGQIWRQIESRRFSYPRNGEFEVVISRGMMNDYRLRVSGNSPMTPIKRLQ